MRVRAPGKVVLLGEYAVLDGAPAIVAAVDRGVQCEVQASADTMRIHTPGDDRFVTAALAAVSAPAAHYRFTDWRPVRTTTKVGLGGSAAATVAAVYAGMAYAGTAPTRAEVACCATRVHRRVQGSGSGIDVAASAFGGVIRFQAGEVAPLSTVHPAVVFSGTTARTGPRVARYLAWSGREAFTEQSTHIVERFAEDPVAALHSGCELLRGMAGRAQIPYWTEGIDALVTLARDCGGAAKPSGAGGGDIVVALFAEEDQRTAYLQQAQGAGFVVVPVEISSGVAHTI